MDHLIAGHVELMFASAGSVTQHVQSGRLRALALTSAHPSALAPGLPTVSAAGLPGFLTLGLYPIFAPAETPAALVSRIRDEIHQAVQRADIGERLLHNGIEPSANTPEELAALLKTEIARWGQFFKDRNIRAE